MSKDEDIFKDAPPDEKEMKIDFLPVEDKEKSKVKGKQRGTTSESKPRGKLVKGELKSNFRRMFNFLSNTIFKSTTVFDDDDFDGLADDFIKLSARFSFVASVIDILTPVFLVMDIIEKMIEIKKGKPQQPSEEKKAA